MKKLNLISRKCAVAISMLVVCLCSCNEKIKKNISDKAMQLVFDASGYHSSDRYQYEYDGDRLITERTVYCQILFDEVVDSTVWYRFFVYDEKGLLCEERWVADGELDATYKNLYDSNDSLICSFNISSEGDTTSWIEYGYFPDGQQIIFSRYFMPVIFPDDFDLAFNSDEDFLKVADAMRETREAMNERDTILCIYEYTYNGNFCTEQKKYDKNHDLVEVVEYLYNNEVIAEEKYYSFSDSVKMLDEIVKYDYSKSNKYPDKYYMDGAGQITGHSLHEFDSMGGLTVLTESRDNGNNIEIEYYKNDQKTGHVSTNKKMNYEIKESISYYDNGKVKEVKTYTKDLK